MNCTNCGAGLRPVGNRDYFRCPYCETFHFPEETEDGIAGLGSATPYACPVCADPLTAAAIDGHEVGYCRTCRGFLSSNAAFGRIVQAKRAKCGSPDHVALPFAPEELRRRVSCPRCRKPMDSHPYHAGGNAVIDTCARCAVVWLDAGELTVIGRYPNRTRATAGLPPLPPSTVADDRPEIDILGFRVRLG